MNSLSLCQFIVFATEGEKVGVWQWIQNCFIAFLEWLYDVTGILLAEPNWVLAIFLFTLVVKLLLQPLMNKQMRSTRRMQLLQPEVDAIKKRFGSNPQKQQQETMKLYKAHGASPTAGCLPLLLQMPILIALFQAIRNYVPADTSNFSFLWIDPLSMSSAEMPGVYGWILPILAAGATFLQQWLTTANRKEKQQQMMLIMMPAMFLFFVRSFPALMSFYWIFYSLIGAAISYPIMKRWERIDRKKIDEMRKAKQEEEDKRRAKKLAAKEAAAKKKVPKKTSSPSYAVETSDFEQSEAVEEDEVNEEDLDDEEKERRAEEAAFRDWAAKRGIKITKKKMRLHPFSPDAEVVELALLPSGKETDLARLRKEYCDYQVQKSMSDRMNKSVVGKMLNKLENVGGKKKGKKEPNEMTDSEALSSAGVEEEKKEN